ncbi:MAG: type transport system permease protein [Acidobacteriota bacterium]|jgi:hypothetical protein|nr:type transport system permease protein [Acidobacteriota bacterium]
MTIDLHLEQARALAWLKWRLFRNAMRSRRAALGSAASVLGTILAVGLALLFAAGIGVAAYGLTDETNPMHPVAMRGGTPEPLLLLFGLLTIIFVMWSFIPLSTGSTSQFDPGRLLLYPISLRKLFLIDFLSDLTSLASIFAVPAVLAVGVGAGIAGGNLPRGLFAALFAAAFGVALAKLFATTVTSLMRRRRGRAETLVAIVSIIAAMSGLIIQFGVRAVAGAKSFPPALLWTPPGALVLALTSGLRENGAQTYARALATLAVYVCLATWLTYRVAVRSLNSSGGAQRSRAVLAAQERATVKPGWQLPLVPATVSTVFEKELRYAMRNAQLRTMMVMPVVMTVALRFAGSSSRRAAFAGLPLSVAPYVEGARAALGVFYVFAITSAITTNCFGYDAAGMRAFVLAPVPRRHVLAGKNLAMLVVMFTSAMLVTAANRIVYGDLGPRALGFTALGFLFYAGAFFSFGNFFSVRFPRRMQYGKRMKASGVAGLLLLPLFLVTIAVPALAVVAGWLAQSVFVEYVILAAFALIAVAAYFLLLNWQARALEERELDILETVARRDED